MQGQGSEDKGHRKESVRGRLVLLNAKICPDIYTDFVLYVFKGFDIMALQELWMEADHTEIADAVPEGYHITGFRQLANKLCDGRVLITTCSGLTIVSRYEFKEVEFQMYTYRGTIWDGEAFAGKGVGRVRIAPRPELEIDVFTTHTIANSGTSMANNTWYRVKQVEELMEKYVSASTAQGVVLAGDFNTAPIQEPGTQFNRKKNWLEFWLAKSLEFWLAIPYTKKCSKMGSLRHVSESKQNLNPFFKPKLKQEFFLSSPRRALSDHSR